MDPYPVLDAKALGLDGILGNAINIMNQQQAGWMGQMHQDYEQLVGQRDQAFQEVQQSAQQPAAQLDPRQEFWSRLAGGLSQAIAPSMQGQQLAETGLDRQRMELQQKQLRTHQILATKYEQAARAAEKAGDNMTSLKMWKNHQGALELIKTAGDQLNNMRTNQTALQKAQLEAGAKQRDRLLPQYNAAMQSAEKADAEAARLIEATKGLGKDQKDLKAQYMRRALAKQAYAQRVRGSATKFMDSGQWGEMPQNPSAIEVARGIVQRLRPEDTADGVIADLMSGDITDDIVAQMTEQGVTPEEVAPLIQQLMTPVHGPAQQKAPQRRPFTDAGLIPSVLSGAVPAIGGATLGMRSSLFGDASLTPEDRALMDYLRALPRTPFMPIHY